MPSPLANCELYTHQAALSETHPSALASYDPKAVKVNAFT